MLFHIFLFYLAILFIILIYKRKQYVDRFPPGPPTLPIFGNIFQVDKYDGRKTFLKWHKKYGPIFTVWLGFKPIVMVTGYELMQELFVKRGDEFSGRPKSFLFSYFPKGNFGIFTSDGDLWKEQRRFTLHALRNFWFSKQPMEGKIQAEVIRLVDSLKRKLDSTRNDSTGLDMKPYLNVCLGNIISSILVGRTYDPNDPTFVELNECLERMFLTYGSVSAQLLNCFPLLRYVPLFGNFGFNDLKRDMDILFQILNDEIKLHKSVDYCPQTNQSNDFVTAYLEEMNKRIQSGNSGYFSEWQLLCIMADLWRAGMETTLTTFQWAFLLMAHYPLVQTKVQLEIDRIIGRDRLPRMVDRPHMPYTVAAIQELQRYANVLTSNIPHRTTRDVQVLGYSIPSDTVIIPQISVLHFDDDVYKDAMMFDPDRFFASERNNHNGKKFAETLLPFSLGKRTCAGETLARAELFLILTSVLQTFNFSFVAENKKPELKGKAGITIAPFSYRLCVTLR